MKQTIHGNCPSKSNSYKIGKQGMYKSKALIKYEKDFYIQCNLYRNKDLRGYFEFHIDVFYPTEKSDLDNSLKIVLDCLQKCKAIPNDNKCVKIVAQKFKSKDNPRIEFEIKQVNI